MKKYISFMLAMVLVMTTCFVSIPAYGATELTEGDFVYTVTNDEASIVSYEGNETGTLTVPDTLGGFPVVSIERYAFSNKTMSGISLPDSLRSLGEYAFNYCRSLTMVTIPSGMTRIEEGTFLGCKKLETVNLHNNVTYIGSYAFEQCAFTSFTMPSNLAHISYAAFYACNKIRTFTIPASVTCIENAVFDACESLTEINVDGANSEYSSQDGILFNKNKTKMLLYPMGKHSTSYTVPETVKELGYGAFHFNKYIQSVTLPDGLTAIDERVFEQATNLASINFPSTLKSIGEYSFYACTSLDSINISNGTTFIGQLAFYNCSNLSDITVPDSVIEVKIDAFDNTAWFANQPDGLVYAGKVLYRLKGSVPSDTVIDNIKNTTLAVAEAAFMDTENVVRIDIPASVIKMDDKFFWHYNSSVEEINVNSENSHYCSEDGVLYTKDKATLLVYPPEKSDVTFIIPDGVNKIKGNAFEESVNLTNLLLPDSVTYIEDDAFLDCYNLKIIVIPESVSCMEESSLASLYNLETIYVDKNSYAEGFIGQQYDELTSIIKYIPAININKNKLSLLKGDTYTLTGSIDTDENAFDNTIIWSSSDESVATVDQNGNVTALKSGKVRITASSVFARKAYCDIDISAEYLGSVPNPETDSDNNILLFTGLMFVLMGSAFTLTRIKPRHSK